MLARHLLSLQLGSLFVSTRDGFLDAPLPAQCSVHPANIVVNRPGVGRVSALIGIMEFVDDPTDVCARTNYNAKTRALIIVLCTCSRSSERS